MILELISEAQASGARLAPACRVLGISARTIERWRADPEAGDRRCGPQRRPSNALSPAEEAQVVTVLTSSRYAGLSPKQLVPQLADEGLYLASESTMYRVQRRHGLRTKKRTTARTQVTRASTVHQATRPEPGVELGHHLAADHGARLVPVPLSHHGRLEPSHRRLAHRGTRVGRVAAALITQSCSDGNVDPRGLVLHSDNGTPMRGSTMISTLQWLGVVPSFSRPHVSDDNPYSEALFRTLKHTPAYPRLPFADLASANRWVARFVDWYNGTHRHSAIRYVTPDQRHHGRERAVLASRHELYERARRANPERWSGSTRNWLPVELVVLNPERAPHRAAA